MRRLAHPVLPAAGRLWGAGRPGYPAEPPAPEVVHAGARAWREAGVDLVVSLIEDHEVPRRAPGLWEALARAGLEVRRFPVVDFGAPADAAAFARLVEEARRRLAAGQGVLAHCNAGLGRTAVFLASLLKAAGLPGDPVAEVRRVYEPDAMREPVQEAFVRGFRPLSPSGPAV